MTINKEDKEDIDKKDVVQIYETYFGLINKIDQHIGSILGKFPTELDKDITQLNNLNEKLQKIALQGKKTAGIATLVSGIPEMAKQLLQVSEEINKIMQAPLNEIYAKNHKLKETLSQLKTTTSKTKENIENQINQTRPRR